MVTNNCQSPSGLLGNCINFRGLKNLNLSFLRWRERAPIWFGQQIIMLLNKMFSRCVTYKLHKTVGCRLKQDL